MISTVYHVVLKLEISSIYYWFKSKKIIFI
jgi:hypothetical protein